MNTLTDAQRERVLAMLREGKKLRRIERETGHRRETIAAYARRAGLLGGVADLADAARRSAIRIATRSKRRSPRGRRCARSTTNSSGAALSGEVTVRSSGTLAPCRRRPERRR
ncbi:hypothetical protein WPS_25030 [Vulcanimicrobium alpinum]|uniref:Uncharacterized protein n=1 Tax=Vulcanimicrobium alpinum TaxID=3016050 RepID=A0AAN2CB19_UNVUL|nr:hypothetical protein [Vulcanimicrobium alpinum]BDE07227.1 hypothetical protein WPS_25030 [Vulcanimicrobium alpinum]